MAIGPDGQEDMHVGMASFPHPASSRARPSAPTMMWPAPFPIRPDRPRPRRRDGPGILEVDSEGRDG